MDAIENKVEGEAAQDMMGGGGNKQQGGGGGGGGGMEDTIINSGTFPPYLLLSVPSLREQRIMS